MATAQGHCVSLITDLLKKKKIRYLLTKDILLPTSKDPEMINDLVTAPKFSMPVCGTIYRPIEDFYEVADDDRIKNAGAELFELEAAKYPPFSSFVLEFDGLGDTNFLHQSMYGNVDKYVIHVKVMSDRAEPELWFRTYYYGNMLVDGDGPCWQTAFVWCRMCPDYREKDAQGRYMLPLLGHQITGPLPEGLLHVLTRPDEDNFCDVYARTCWIQARALMQFFVALNSKRGIRQTEERVKAPKSTFIRRPEYEYKTIDIDPMYVQSESSVGGGTHSSPRFHVRRAHLRHYGDGKVTFVRQAFVGDPALGRIEKDYRVLPV